MADYQALYLGSIFNNKKNPPCCPLVVFENSDTVEITGLGTIGNPFILTANVGPSLTANDGLSLSGVNIQLGQLVGQEENPAELTESREIPLNGFNLQLTGSGMLQTPGASITGEIQDADGNTGISMYARPGTIPSGGFTYSINDHSIVQAQEGFLGFIGIMSEAVIIGDTGGDEHGKFTNYATAFGTLLAWEGNLSGGTATLGTMLGYFSGLTSVSGAGAVTKMYDFYASEANTVGFGGSTPTITNHYALYAESFTRATNNYGIYINGTQTNYLGGKLGIGETAPSALIHLKAGTATAGSAPIKLTAGTLLTTAENGALEYDGTHLYFTIGTTRTQII